MSDDLGEVHFYASDLYADVLGLIFDVLHQLSTVEQAFGGNTANVQAGAAQVLLFNERDLGAQLCGTDGRHIAAGAAAHYQHSLCPCLRSLRGQI